VSPTPLARADEVIEERFATGAVADVARDQAQMGEG